MRLASTARLLLGASQVARPEFLARDGAGDELTLRAIRVLGARDLVQGVITLIRPSRRVIRVGAAVDTIHALSMVGLAVVDRRRRATALASAANAAGFALAGLRAG
ncbi:MAG: hypothetical protein WAK18_03945 [Nocardioidaceae bacterium]